MFSSLFRRGVYEWFYLAGRPRWDTGITPPELRNLIEYEHLAPCRALDVGCGTGTNVIYLAQHGFEVTGIDFVPRAINKARAKARAAKVAADFRLASVLAPIPFEAPFGLVVDIGCFHNFGPQERARYAENLATWTARGSIFLLYAFYPRSAGPRRFGVKPEEVEETFASAFHLVRSTAGENGPEQDSAWYRLERV